MEVTLGKLTSFPDRMGIRSDHVEAENVNKMKVPHVQITVASPWKRGRCTLTQRRLCFESGISQLIQFSKGPDFNASFLID